MTSATKTLISLGLAHALLEWFSGVWPIFKVLAHLDLDTSAQILAGASFISAVLQPLFGIWADKGYARSMALGGTVLTFLLMFVGPISNYMPVWGPLAVYSVLAGITLISRMGHSMFHPAGAMLASRAFDADKHTASLGIFISMGWIGYGLSQIAFSAAYLNFGGHSEVLLLPGILAMFWINGWCKPAPQHHAHVRTPFREVLGNILTYRRDLGLLFALMCLTGAANSALFFLFPELMESKGYTGWVLNGGAQGFMIAGTALGVLVSGYCAEGMGERLTLILSMAANIVAWHGFLMFPHTGDALFLAGCLIGGLLFGFGSTLPISMGQKLIPRNASMISGVMMGWSWAIANLAPLAAAKLAGTASAPRYGIFGALTILGVLNVLALICSVFLKPGRQTTTVIKMTEELPAQMANAQDMRV